MYDPLNTRLPLLHSGMSIALRDTFDADDDIWVPLEYGGVSCRANALGSLPSHARIPVLNGGLTLSPAQITAINPGSANLLGLENQSGNWEWENGSPVTWPEGGTPNA
jgi:hypothetical protein